MSKDQYSDWEGCRILRDGEMTLEIEDAISSYFPFVSPAFKGGLIRWIGGSIRP